MLIFSNITTPSLEFDFVNRKMLYEYLIMINANDEKGNVVAEFWQELSRIFKNLIKITAINFKNLS